MGRPLFYCLFGHLNRQRGRCYYFDSDLSVQERRLPSSTVAKQKFFDFRLVKLDAESSDGKDLREVQAEIDISRLM